MQDISQNQKQITQDVTPQQQQVGSGQPPEGSGGKEHEPGTAVKPESVDRASSPQMEIKPVAHSEITPPRELENTAEKGPDAKEPKIEEELRHAGVKLAKESTPLITTPTGKIQLPLNYSQAVQKKKKTSFFDSVHWYAALIMYLWKKHDPDIVKKS